MTGIEPDANEQRDHRRLRGYWQAIQEMTPKRWLRTALHTGLAAGIVSGVPASQGQSPQPSAPPPGPSLHGALNPAIVDGPGVSAGCATYPTPPGRVSRVSFTVRGLEAVLISSGGPDVYICGQAEGGAPTPPTRTSHRPPPSPASLECVSDTATFYPSGDPGEQLTALDPHKDALLAGGTKGGQRVTLCIQKGEGWTAREISF